MPPELTFYGSMRVEVPYETEIIVDGGQLILNIEGSGSGVKKAIDGEGVVNVSVRGDEHPTTIDGIPLSENETRDFGMVAVSVNST